MSNSLEPMDCSPPGCSVHGIPQARTLEWVSHFLLQELFPTQGSNLHLLTFAYIGRWALSRELHLRSPKSTLCTDNEVCLHLSGWQVWYYYLCSTGEHPEAGSGRPADIPEVKN